MAAAPANPGADILVPHARLQELEVAAARADQLEAALAVERARCERQAETLMNQPSAIANMMREEGARHTAAIAEQRASHQAVVAAKDATITHLQTALFVLFPVVVVLVGVGISRASTISTQISGCATHSAVASPFALEIRPVRPDHRQFAILHDGPVPPLHWFDHRWSTAVCGDG
jgi:hypothetical protein